LPIVGHLKARERLGELKWATSNAREEVRLLQRSVERFRLRSMIEDGASGSVDASLYTEDGGRSIMAWHDIIALAIGVPALAAYVWFVKDVAPTEAPRRGMSLSALLVLGSIWRSGGRS
jgi:hypothetical protein